MSYNGSGTFVINSTGQPVVTGTVISSSTFNSLTADLGTGLSTAITKDGQTTTTAKIPFALGISAAVASNFAAGTVAAPSIYLSTDTGTGFYRIGANNNGYSVSGTKLLDFSSALLAVTGAATVSTTLGVTGATTLSSTLGVSGVITRTATAASNSSGLILTGSTTGNHFVQVNNTGGTLYSGVDGSAGSSFTGVAAYGSFVGTAAGTTMNIGSNGIVTLTSNAAGTGVTIPGTLGVGAAPVSEKMRVQAAAGFNFVVDSASSSMRISAVNDADSLNVPMILQATSINVGGANAPPITIPGTLGVTGASISLVPTAAADPLVIIDSRSANGRTSAIDYQVKTAGAVDQRWFLGVQTIATDGSFELRNVTGGTVPFKITTAGIVTMSAYGAGAATFSSAGVISSVSDETWKIKDGIPTDPDAMLQKLAPGYWFYNEEKRDTFGTDRQLGFYAQNVNAAIGPEAAPEPEEGKPWGYYDRSVLAVAVMSLQSALTNIQTLSAKVAALEAR